MGPQVKHSAAAGQWPVVGLYSCSAQVERRLNQTLLLSGPECWGDLHIVL